jgi:hypothetical protein
MLTPTPGPLTIVAVFRVASESLTRAMFRDTTEICSDVA